MWRTGFFVVQAIVLLLNFNGELGIISRFSTPNIYPEQLEKFDY
jgi:hypothetical protein